MLKKAYLVHRMYPLLSHHRLEGYACQPGECHHFIHSGASLHWVVVVFLVGFFYQERVPSTERKNDVSK